MQKIKSQSLLAQSIEKKFASEMFLKPLWNYFYTYTTLNTVFYGH